jgi:hypothetical protein
MINKNLEEALKHTDVEDAKPEDVARIIRDFADDGLTPELLVRLVKMIAMMRNTAALVAKWDEGKLRIAGLDEDDYPMFDELNEDDEEEPRPNWSLN